MSDTAELLRAAYGREVPTRVRLTEDFDGPDWSPAKPGDVVDVAHPFADVETDDSSLFVELPHSDGEQRLVERVYDHEWERAE